MTNELKELHVAREAMVKERTAAKNRARTLTLAFLKKQNRTRLAHIERRMKAIEHEIMALIAGDPDLSWRFDIITSIQAVQPSPPLAFRSICRNWKALSRDRPQVWQVLPPLQDSLASGPATPLFVGTRATVRQALYMPALVAMRFNPDLKVKYRQLKEAGTEGPHSENLQNWPSPRS